MCPHTPRMLGSMAKDRTDADARRTRPRRSLTIAPELWSEAERLARNQNMSVSRLFETFVIAELAREKKRQRPA